MPHSGGRYRETLDHLLEGFQIIDREYRYVYVNPAAAKQGRTTAEALIGKTMPEAYPGIEASPLFAVLARCFEQQIVERIENLFEFPDGSKRWFELRIEPVPEGLCIHSVDIHDRKQVEDELRRTNAELERRIAERTHALLEANRELEAFSYSVAHDLRAPLRSIDGFSQMLQEDCGALLDDNCKSHLARVRTATQRMATLIDDLLALSRVTRSEIDRVDVDLSRMAKSIAHSLDERDPARKVTWEIDEGVSAHCDPALARILLENLLGNAWKFTAKTTDAHVRVTRGDGTAVEVRDNGVGFDMRYAHHLFTPFRRLHGEREFAGTGIGLALAQKIVSYHGGSIWIDEHVAEGTTIRWTLPTDASEGTS